MVPLKFEDVSLYHPRLGTLFDGVSFSLDAGFFVALAGGTGSQKRALFRLACGLMSPTAGRITVFGQKVEPSSPPKGLFPIFSDPDSQFVSPVVADDLGITLESRGLDSREIREKSAEALHLVGLEGYGTRPVSGLSGGEKKRLLLAHGLLTGSRLILVEEPSAMLDNPAKTRLFELLRSMTAHGKTVLATADRAQTVLAADSLLAIEGSRVVHHSDAAEFVRAKNSLSKIGLSGDAAQIASSLVRMGEASFGSALTPEEVFDAFKARKGVLI
jgi:energy-coupling factor transporter ATP-binding protein EcfA2